MIENEELIEKEHTLSFEGIEEGDPVIVKIIKDEYPAMQRAKFIKYIDEPTSPIEESQIVVGRWLESKTES